MLIISFDLAGAEWVVTAYLADDERMIAVANGPDSPHVVTGSLISGAPMDLVLEEHKLVGAETNPNMIDIARQPIIDKLSGYFIPRTMSIRQAGKKSNHGLNYRMQYRRFALENEMPESDAAMIVNRYSEEAYPGLKDFWKWVEGCLKNNKRTMENCFGRKIPLYDAWGPDLLNKATSCVPQSTVFDVCRIGMCRAYEDTTSAFQPARLLLQVHDSLDYEYPLNFAQMAHFILVMVYRHMRVPLHYNGHEFVLGVDVKVGLSRGRMVPLKVEDDHDVMVRRLREISQALREPLGSTD